MPARLAAVAAMILVSGAAEARELFVTNEKGNSVTIIDGDTLEVNATVPVGNRPRGIVAQPGRQVPLHLRVGRRHDPDHGHRRRQQLVGDLPSGPDPEQMSISPDGKTLYVANEDDNMVTRDRRREPHGDRPRSRSASSPRAWASATTASGSSTPPRPPTWRTSSTRDVPRDHRQRPRRPAAALRRVHQRRRRGLGHLRGRRHGQRDRQQDRARSSHKITFAMSRRAERGDPAGRHQDHQGPQTGLRGAGRRQPGRRDRRPDLSRSRTTSWSASASGSWPSARTRSRSTRRTACPTTSRSSTLTASRS